MLHPASDRPVEASRPQLSKNSNKPYNTIVPHQPGFTKPVAHGRPGLLLGPLPFFFCYLPLDIARLYGVALVIRGLAPGQADLDICLSVLEVYLRGHQGIALFPGLAQELHYLLFMEEEFSGPFGLVLLEAVGLAVRAYVRVKEEYLPVFYARVAVLQVGLAGPEGFDLCASEHDACFKGLFDEVVVKGLFVLRYYVYRQLLHPEVFGR